MLNKRYQKFDDVTMEALSASTKSVFDVSFLELIESKSRVQYEISIREIIIYNLRSLGWTFEDIGDLFKRNHSSIQNSLSNYYTHYKYEVKFKEVADNFQRSFTTNLINLFYGSE